MTLTQPSLFDAKPKPVVLSPVAQEKKRFSRQCRAILDRLQCGRATNAELAAIALKYTSRVSDLRAAGCKIEVVDRCYETGLVTYELKI